MKFVSMIVIAATATATLSAQTVSEDRPHLARRGPPPPDAVLGETATLPIVFESGLPTIEAKIDGQAIRLGIDSGAAGIHLTATVAARLDLQAVGEGLAGDPSGANPVPMKIYRLEAAQFGGVTVKGVEAVALAVEPVRRDGVDGVVSPNIFQNLVVAIDYPHACLVLHRGSLPSADGRTIFHYDGFAPTMPLEIEGRTQPAEIDTGNTRFGIVLPTAFVGGLHRRAKAREIGQGRTTSSTVQMFATALDGSAHLAGVALDSSEAAWPAVTPIANVGSDGLRGLLVEIDVTNHRVRINRTPD